MLLCSCSGVPGMLSIFAICTIRPIRKGIGHGRVRKPYVLRQTFDFLKLEACCHPCSNVASPRSALSVQHIVSCRSSHGEWICYI